jgi:hypothetical protein
MKYRVECDEVQSGVRECECDEVQKGVR